MTATDSPAMGGGSTCRRGLIPADCWRDSVNAVLTTAGVLACLAALYGLAVLTRPLGVLLLELASGGN